jgi:hypothetical protein
VYSCYITKSQLSPHVSHLNLTLTTPLSTYGYFKYCFMSHKDQLFASWFWFPEYCSGCQKMLLDSSGHYTHAPLVTHSQLQLQVCVCVCVCARACACVCEREQQPTASTDNTHNLYNTWEDSSQVSSSRKFLAVHSSCLSFLQWAMTTVISLSVDGFCCKDVCECNYFLAIYFMA